MLLVEREEAQQVERLGEEREQAMVGGDGLREFVPKLTKKGVSAHLVSDWFPNPIFSIS